MKTALGRSPVRYLAGIAAALLVSFVAPKPGYAQGADSTVKCKDGTTSTVTGRGACSHHGGVAGAGGATNPPGATTAPPAGGAAAPTTPAAGGKTASTSTTSTTGSGKSEDNDPTGAIAKCKDGMYSHSKHHSGSCSGHGGVAQWLDGTTKP
jgi:hypothetical protein